MVDSVVGWLAERLTDLNPDLGPVELEQVLKTGNVVGWYLSPRRHVVETVGVAVFVAIVHALLSRHYRVHGAPVVVPRRRSGQNWVDLVDRIIQTLCSIAWGLLFFFKCSSGRAAYLLQPCNLGVGALMYLGVDKRSKFATWLFNFYLNTMYGGALIAWAAPDMRDHDLFFEKETWILVHILLVVVPWWWVATRRYPVKMGWRASLGSTMTFFLVHFTIYVAAGIILATNVNYMMTPALPLISWGKSYRITTGLMFAGFMACMKLLMVDVVLARWTTVSAAREAGKGVGTEDAGSTPVALPSTSEDPLSEETNGRRSRRRRSTRASART